MSKKILIITEYYYPEEFKINEVAQDWKNKGYQVDILTNNPTYPHGQLYPFYKNRWFAKQNYNGMSIYRLKTVTNYKNNLFKKLIKYFNFMILGSFISLIIGRNYNYVFGFAGGSLTGMVPAVILRQFYKKPVTLWVQDIWPDTVYAYGFKKTKISQFLLDVFVKYIYRNSSNFAITSKGFENKILSYADNSKEILYAPNWADYLNINLQKISLSNSKKIQFTFAGNVGSVQNIDNIILAFGQLNYEYTNKVQLNIIGDGSYLEKIKKIVKVNNLKNIIFWGIKPRSEIYKYLEASDFLIVSLINREIFSLTVPAKTQTYVAAGKPIIAIINGEAADLIKQNNLGLVCPPDDIEIIKATFIEAINKSDEEKEIYTKNSYFLSNTIFKKEKIIDDLLELLKRG